MLRFTFSYALRQGIRFDKSAPIGQFVSYEPLRFTHTAARLLNNNLVTIEPVPEQNTTIIHLHRGPANAFNHELARTVTDVFKQIEEDKSVRTVIFASKIPHFFSAGVDLEDFKRSDELWLDFWKDLRKMFITIHGSRLNTIAAVNGFAVGLGCALALGNSVRMISHLPSVTNNMVNQRAKIATCCRGKAPLVSTQ
ncbi:ClpP/crotonase [Basidiobolus meristosporus CBS 931.73]|uniref:ClpP/crotonase n=1 Tax=Basidiobolus meristosporus CBS 931.73 TaxID=1314790 RepID=A0A1Y1YCN8_9FUNG|nr:ClpP/crotonase [Basidiobolus meristosporus CBS 931.73]|eukprot:ORX95759.1 ClpP/crotonase [Basidiobolus meristosporus CBS 931.73]